MVRSKGIEPQCIQGRVAEGRQQYVALTFSSYLNNFMFTMFKTKKKKKKKKTTKTKGLGARHMDQNYISGRVAEGCN